MKKVITISVLYFFNKSILFAQANLDSSTETKWTNHFQFTTIVQSHAGFNSPYSGNNSLADSVEVEATTATATLFLGHKLWKGAAIYFNPELSGGRGLSSAIGVAGALNGESYRVGNSVGWNFICYLVYIIFNIFIRRIVQGKMLLQIASC